MRPNNLFQMEMAAVAANKQSLMMKPGFTFLVALPLIFIDMPIRGRTAGLLMLLVFTSFFGAAVGSARRRTEGRLTQLRLLPLPTWQVWGDTLLADALFVLVRMGAVIALFMAVHGERITAGAILRAGGLLFLTVMILNALGMLIGFVMKNNQEAHLIGALIAGSIAFFSGILPAPDQMRDLIQGFTPWNPLAILAGVLEGMANGVDLGTGGGAMGHAVFLALLLGVFLFRALDVRMPFRLGSPRDL